MSGWGAQAQACAAAARAVNNPTAIASWWLDPHASAGTPVAGCLPCDLHALRTELLKADFPGVLAIAQPSPSGLGPPGLGGDPTPEAGPAAAGPRRAHAPGDAGEPPPRTLASPATAASSARLDDRARAAGDPTSLTLLREMAARVTYNAARGYIGPVSGPEILALIDRAEQLEAALGQVIDHALEEWGVDMEAFTGCWMAREALGVGHWDEWIAARGLSVEWEPGDAR